MKRRKSTLTEVLYKKWWTELKRERKARKTERNEEVTGGQEKSERNEEMVKEKERKKGRKKKEWRKVEWQEKENTKKWEDEWKKEK